MAIRIPILGLLTLLLWSPGIVSAADDLELLLKEYRSAEEKMQAAAHSRAERISFWEEWLPQLVKAQENNPRSPIRKEVLVTALGLSNSLGSYGESIEIALALVSVEEDEALKWRWHAEVGALLKKQFQQTGSPQSLQDSIDAYQRSLESARSIAFGERADTYAQQYFVLNLSSLANLLSRGYGDHQTAAERFREARKLIKAGTVATEGLLKDFDEEYFASKEFMSWIQANEDEHAEEALHALTELPTLRKPVSRYFRELLTTGLDWDSQGYRETIEYWYDRLPDDSEKPIVLYELGMSHSRVGEDGQATAIFEDLRTNNKEKLIAFDLERSEAGFWNGEGVYPTVLTKLIASYRHQKRYEEAIEVSSEFLQLFPECPQAASIKSDLDWMQAKLNATIEISRPTDDRPGGISTQTLIALNGLAFLLAIGVWAVRWYLAKKSHRLG